MKRSIFSSILLCTLAFELSTYVGCTNPITPANNFTLSVADVSCTEAWLNLHVNNVPANVVIYRNNNIIFNWKMTTRDTIVYDSALSPNKSYTYQAAFTSIKSNPVTVKTMDTTSQNWSFQTFYFGGASSSYLSNIAIVNDTLAYAVGAIYKSDSTGIVDQNAYNFVKWNGQSWQLLRIQFYTVRGGLNYTPYPTSSILVFNESDIWIAMDGDQTVHWDGQAQNGIMFLPNSFSIKKIWGKNSNIIYTIGDNVNFDTYTNGLWQKIESGIPSDQGNSSINFTDIDGLPDNSQLFICGSSIDQSNSILTKYDGSNFTTLWKRNVGVTPPYGDIVRSLWVNNKTLYLASNYGIFYQNINAPNNVKKSLSIYHYPYCIRGSNKNNIVVVGDNSMIWHFNGVSWKLLNLTGSTESLYSVAVTDNMIVAVGTDYSQQLSRAKIYIGRR